MMMYSTQNKQERVSLEDAVMRGLAADGGLYLPVHIPQLPESFFKQKLSFPERCFQVARTLLQGAISDKDLQQIIEAAISFNAPLQQVSEHVFALELFHGPTLSFKDFGARFMAQLMGYFNRNSDQSLHILTATSGDTGSAIGQAFYQVPGIQVWILYPKGRVSEIQEKQLTTIGGNVNALEIEGSFDDCQQLVKQAFADTELRNQRRLTSANSINIARLIPQSFYYFDAFASLDSKRPIVFSVPSGNFGNLTGGILAKRMGLPVSKFVAATNCNDSVPCYLETGVFTPHLSRHTISNAMDVGNPSNFARLLDLYQHSRDQMALDIAGRSFSDAQTMAAMEQVQNQTGYLMDPHGAVAYLGLQSTLKPGEQGVFLETAHPVKFSESVELPERLKALLVKEKRSIILPSDYEALRELLL